MMEHLLRLHFKAQTSAEHFKKASEQDIHEARSISYLCHLNKNESELLSFSMTALKIPLKPQHYHLLYDNHPN